MENLESFMLYVAVPAICNHVKGRFNEIYSRNGGGETMVHLMFFTSAREISKII